MRIYIHPTIRTDFSCPVWSGTNRPGTARHTHTHVLVFRFFSSTIMYIIIESEYGTVSVRVRYCSFFCTLPCSLFWFYHSNFFFIYVQQRYIFISNQPFWSFTWYLYLWSVFMDVITWMVIQTNDNGIIKIPLTFSHPLYIREVVNDWIHHRLKMSPVAVVAVCPPSFPFQVKQIDTLVSIPYTPQWNHPSRDVGYLPNPYVK